MGEDDGSAEDNVPQAEVLRLEIAELRAENDRLRGLLGLGTRDEAVSPWEPTLFVEPEGDDSAIAAVDGNRHANPRSLSIRSLFVGRDDSPRPAVGEHSNRQGRMEPGRAGRMGEYPEA